MRSSTLLPRVALLTTLASNTLASRISPAPFADLLAKLKHTKNGNDPLTVELGYSQYRGTFNSSTNIDSWKGIRFAAAPIGDLRWQSPQPPALDRSQVMEANRYGSQCPQSPFGNPQFETSEEYAGDDEDCLFLNVFAPHNASNLPVMVWIHG